MLTNATFDFYSYLKALKAMKDQTETVDLDKKH